MKNLFKTVLVFAGGMLAGLTWYENRTNEGEVIYENDDMYIRADKNAANGTSWAKVFYKKPR